MIDRVPPAFIRLSAKKRRDFAMDKINEFNVDAVIWYELLNCETYDAESYYFEKELSEFKMPILVLGADYGQADIEQIKIRINAFIEMAKGGLD